MQISRLIKELQRLKDAEGDLEVTCTGSLERETTDPMEKIDGKPFESTVETLEIQESDALGKHVRLFWQC